MTLSQKLKNDLIPSFIVFLVALPLSLGIALASGASARAGIVAAVVGGILVGLFSGAPLQVSGPAAGLSILVFGLIQTHGFETTCLIVSIAGCFQIIFGLLKVSRVALMIAPPVIHGMLAGIGALIALGQSHVVLGFKPAGSGLTNLTNLPNSILHAQVPAISLGIATLGILIVWPRLFPKISKTLPASLLAVIALSLLAWTFNLSVSRVELESGLLSPSIAWNTPQLDHTLIPVLISAATLFLVASAESLLCAIATDRLHTGPRANLDRELLAQGAGNFISGLLGGLPITGVIVRSATNISSGAKTRYSAVLHGIWILIFGGFASTLITHIPLAVLAALLIYVGFNLIKIEHIRHLKHYGEHWIYFATLFGVVFFGLLNGIGIGVGLSIIALLYRLSSVGIDLREVNSHEYELRIVGSLTFLSVPKVSVVLNKIPPGHLVKIIPELSQLDLAGLETVRNWRIQYTQSGGRVDKPNLDDWIKR